MKAVFKGIGRALKVAFRASLKALRFSAVATLGTVGTLSNVIFGRDTEVEDLPEPEQVAGPLDLDEIEDPIERDEVLKARLLHRIQPYASAYEYAVTPAARREHVDISKLPLGAAVWVKQLSDPELRRVRVAGLQAMCDHLIGARTIPGVSRPKMPLKDFTAFIDAEPTAAFEGELALAGVHDNEAMASSRSYRLH